MSDSDTDAGESMTGDNAFTATSNRERAFEPTYSGALSFLRRRYTRDLTDVDVVVSGIPFDSAVTIARVPALALALFRAASVQPAELQAFPSGIDLVEVSQRTTTQRLLHWPQPRWRMTGRA